MTSWAQDEILGHSNSFFLWYLNNWQRKLDWTRTSGLPYQCSSTGQTAQSLRQRITNRNTEKPVAEHFNLPGHSLSQLTVAILQQRRFTNWMEREAAKQKLIHKLDCIDRGLNRDSCSLSHYISELIITFRLDSTPVPYIYLASWCFLHYI